MLSTGAGGTIEGLETGALKRNIRKEEKDNLGVTLLFILYSLELAGLDTPSW
jgi:hypothetical protein